MSYGLKFHGQKWWDQRSMENRACKEKNKLSICSVSDRENWNKRAYSSTFSPPKYFLQLILWMANVCLQHLKMDIRVCFHQGTKKRLLNIWRVKARLTPALKSKTAISRAFHDFDDGFFHSFIIDMKSAEHENWEIKVHEDAEIELKHEEIMNLRTPTF